MKAILFISLICFLITTASSQNNQTSSEKKDTIKLLCQKWVLTTMSAQGKTANVPNSEAMYITFYTDGSYIDSSARFSVSRGTWTYDNKTQFLYTTEKGGKTNTKVVKVTADELIVEMKYPTAIMTAAYKRVN